MGVFLHLDVAPYTLFQEPSKLACLQRRGIARCGVAYRRPLATLVFIGLHRAAPSMPRFPSIPCKHARSESLSVVPSVFEGIGVHDPTLGALG